MEKIKLKKLDNNQNFQESNGSISDFTKQNFLNSKNESQQLQNPKHLLNYKSGNQNQQQQNQNQGQNNRVLKQTVNMPLLKQKKQKPFQKEENLLQEKNQSQLEEVKLAKLVAGKKVQKTSLPIQNFDVPDFQLSMNFNSNYRPYSEDNVSNKKMMEKLREQAEIQESSNE
ncbi:hypothetical protein PPERSA_03265 [Pseudocohnilembus persalinus]|uniref:Uncharacterized protein n=1 Tax=Pseudocohnilembus persalinus TaxID=266149 RepID=A0A0V0QZW0_PSEPJ|nr:hypothetical protein PPERSA_03265 [Pseudocohnilembus persalinus]|eukprot:KRX07432.1 hypothetical protein PPERSA_03265 [Pseudocohnilembus persalinus]